MRFAARLAFLFLLAGCLFAGTLGVQNPSFEAPDIGVMFAWATGSFVTGWQTSGVYISQPQSGDFTNLASQQVITWGSIWQDLSDPIAGGRMYVLTVLVGNRMGNDYGNTYSISLLAVNGGSSSTLGSISASISTIPDATFAPIQLTAFAPPGSDGQTLRIQLSSSGSQASFDDVALALMPEPSTIALLALGGGLLALLRRRRLVIPEPR
ncbi:MAG: PEP-CTERM sorting domain-containing protein [Acidobacteriia bacterium]|nr:PEP-CTERM sorting domain-containing protein [Terriglobia bacterium]